MADVKAYNFFLVDLGDDLSAEFAEKQMEAHGVDGYRVVGGPAFNQKTRTWFVVMERDVSDD